MCFFIDQTWAPKWVSLPVTLKKKWGQKCLMFFWTHFFNPVDARDGKFFTMWQPEMAHRGWLGYKQYKIKISYWPEKCHCVPLPLTISSILLIKYSFQQLLTLTRWPFFTPGQVDHGSLATHTLKEQLSFFAPINHEGRVGWKGRKVRFQLAEKKVFSLPDPWPKCRPENLRF